MIGGFGSAGVPSVLVAALSARNLRDLTVIANGLRLGPAEGPAATLQPGMVANAILSFPVPPGAGPDEGFVAGYESGRIGLEIVPQGTLAERIRAGGAGVAAF